MRNNIKYFRLFEVHILHEYFLLAEDNLSYFDLPKTDRSNWLEKRLAFDQYKLAEAIRIVPTRECAKTLKNYRLKFIQTATGMTIGFGTKYRERADNIWRWVPEIPFQQTLDLAFIIKVKDPFFKNYTSNPFNSKQPGNYLFSNSKYSVQGNDFHSLSLTPPAFESGRQFRAGDIVNHDGVLKEAFADTTNSNFWEEIESSGYANENDRRYYPKSFSYFPRQEETSGPMEFILKDIRDPDQILKEITTAKPSVLGFRLDFSTVRPREKDTEVPLPDGVYLLEIKSSSGTREQEIFLSSEFSQSDFGLIHIRVGESGIQYPGINSSSEIINLDILPVFEIRLRSRKTFWRFQARQNGKKLRPDGIANFFRDDEHNNAIDGMPANMLITKIPQKLARLPVQIRDGSGITESFPQPKPYPIKRKTGPLASNEPPGRIFSDVYITTINGKIDVTN